MRRLSLVSLVLLVAASAVSAGTRPPLKPLAQRCWETAWHRSQRDLAGRLASYRTQLRRGRSASIFRRGDPRRPLVALTFDDGPHPGYTPQILDVLRRAGAKATFFVVGEQAARYPELVRAIARDGHCLGNHTQHHRRLWRLSAQEVAAEVRACNVVLQAICGRPAKIFRPPGGRCDGTATEVIGSLGLVQTGWTLDTSDFREPGEDYIFRYTTSRMKPGAVVLMHDGAYQSLRVLPSAITRLQRGGYRFVTVEDLLRDRR